MSKEIWFMAKSYALGLLVGSILSAAATTWVFAHVTECFK